MVSYVDGMEYICVSLRDLVHVTLKYFTIVNSVFNGNLDSIGAEICELYLDLITISYILRSVICYFTLNIYSVNRRSGYYYYNFRPSSCL